VKTAGSPGRLLATLAGAALLTASMLAAGGPAAAAPARPGHPDPRATALAHILHHGLGPCHTATNCWAVGSYGAGTGLDQALHWDGGTWSLVDTPEPGGGAAGDANNLASVRCNTSADCWAVGEARMSGGPIFSQALHWNGTTWSSR
jgi:hypothetical protein